MHSGRKKSTLVSQYFYVYFVWMEYTFFVYNEYNVNTRITFLKI